jgi:hypothetical protein
MRKLLILVSAVAFMVAFTLPAAADVSFYGQARMWTGWANSDPDVEGEDSTTNVFWDMDKANTRFGARFKNDSVAGNVEIRPNDSNYMRHWYGSWNWGGGTLIVGQTWTPTFAPVCSNCSEGGYGGFFGDNWGTLRQPQVAVHIGSLQLATMVPVQVAYAGGDAQGMLPRIEASYDLKAGPAGIKLFAGFNSSEEETATTTYDYNSYLAGGKVSFGVGALGVGVVLWVAKNPKEYGHTATQAMTAAIDGDDVNEVDSMGFAAEVGYQLSPMMKLYAGFGQANHELDQETTYEKTDTGMYAGLIVTLAKNVTLTPEILIRTDETKQGSTTTEPKTTYYGAYWQINF